MPATLYTAEELRAIAYRATQERGIAFRAAAEARLVGDAAARYDLGVYWEPVANRDQDPDYHVLP